MTYGFKNDLSNLMNLHEQFKVMLDKSTVYDALAEGMYFFGQKPVKF